jgi:hypothetical protein
MDTHLERYTKRWHWILRKAMTKFRWIVSATRRRAVKCREENMRKEGNSLKIEGTGQWEWGGGNEHIPPRQPDGASRLLVKGAVRKGWQDPNSAKSGGAESVSMKEAGGTPWKVSWGKHEKRREQLEDWGHRPVGMERGQRTHPAEATRRRVKVAREGCREERVTKHPNSAKSGGAESVSMKEAWKVWHYLLAVHRAISNCVPHLIQIFGTCVNPHDFSISFWSRTFWDEWQGGSLVNLPWMGQRLWPTDHSEMLVSRKRAMMISIGLAYLIGRNLRDDARCQDQRILAAEESLERCEDCHHQSGCRCQQREKKE